MDSLSEMAQQGEFLIGLLNELACWALAPGAESFFRSLLLGRIWMRSLFECSKYENQAVFLLSAGMSSGGLEPSCWSIFPRRKLQPKQ
ncbi:uncharacterized protein [Zea mays]|uniref:uncharacterized protein isoform X6 n=1 Tax=Zea mays TaxID=4577 RepID=UPI0004DE7CCE|nr:uncharacterized protein LOC103640373 isoform X6 [Zea mays]|eukprot:XP_008661205.1 uncharacterized protein LOC103640373 isoform X6 [Zea mays]